LTPRNESAASTANAIILLVAITIVVAGLVLLMCLSFPMPSGEAPVRAVFKITNIYYTLSGDGIHHVGIVVVTNTDEKDYRNRYLKVNTYVNGNLANCNIPTLNNDLFCTIDHTGLSHLWGVGTWGNMNSPTAVWPAHSEISIEYKKGRLRPGDRITLEFIDTNTNQIISRDTFPHSDIHDAQWFYNYFLNRQGT
jgi:hypothetical protein